MVSLTFGSTARSLTFHSTNRVSLTFGSTARVNLTFGSTSRDNLSFGRMFRPKILIGTARLSWLTLAVLPAKGQTDLTELPISRQILEVLTLFVLPVMSLT